MDILRKILAKDSHFIHRTLRTSPVFICNTYAISSHANKSWAKDKSKPGTSAQYEGIGKKNKCKDWADKSRKITIVNEGYASERFELES